MEKNYWSKIETIIDEALSLPKKNRENFINEQCNGNESLKSEVTILLESIIDSKGWLENPEEYKEALYSEICEKPDIQDCQPLIGQTIDSYTITEKLGEGGMGSVYLSERSDGAFEHRVAIKIIRNEKASAENIRRFERERTILAGLSHPNIAKLFDGGITPDGHPYFVMEYVDGIPIDTYCKENNCSIAQRLELFKQILNAVRHAHENLIVHRDLKPTNILVNQSGKVTILDFGISKLLQDEQVSENELTQTGALLLTPKYAAPEQILQSPITTATDIYALGIIFYQLISNAYPFELDGLSQFEVERTILETNPPKPSTKTTDQQRSKKLYGDLDVIALKAIRKEANRRYRSATEFLDDLNNYQQGLPVSAQNDSLIYLTQKFFERHKQGVIATTVIAIIFISFASFYTLRITEERNEATFEAKKAENVSNFLMDLFQANDPTEALGDTVTARTLLDRGVQRARLLQDQPKIQAQMFDVIGQVYRRLGKYQESKKLLEQAVILRQNQYGPTHPETGVSLNHLGLLLCDMGAYQKAENILRKSLEVQKMNYGKGHLKVAQAQGLLAYALRRRGKYEEAEKLYRNSLTIRRKKLGPDDQLTIQSESSLGATLHNEGKYKEAEKLYREVLALRREILGPSHPDIAMSLNNLAALLMNEGQFKEAGPLLKEALVMRKKLFGEQHPKVALTMNNLALILRDQHKYDEAEALFKKALVMRCQLLGTDNVATAITQYGLAGLMLQTQRPDSALSLYQKALSVFRNKLSEKHSFTARTIMGMGSAYLAKNNFKQAQKLLQRGFRIVKKIHSPTSLERALAEVQMGAYWLKRQRYTAADSLLSHSYNTLKVIEGPSSPRQLQAKHYLIQVHNKVSLK